MSDDSDYTAPCACGGELHFVNDQRQPHAHRVDPDEARARVVKRLRDALEAAEAENTRLRAQIDAVKALVAPIIDRIGRTPAISTHSTSCHEYHVGCLALAVVHRLPTPEGPRGD